MAILGSESEGGVDWAAASRAARNLTDPGALDRSPETEMAYAEDLRAARREIRAVTGTDFELPARLELRDRHHWIEATLGTLEPTLEPLAARTGRFPTLAGTLNTASVAGSVAYLARQVLGQFDPVLLGDDEQTLSIVYPNLTAAATELDVAEDRFRRWIVFHEVTHVAEFGMAPWLRPYLADRLTEVIDELAHGSMAREPYRELTLAMTAVEGYAELLMDAAFDRESADLRRKLEARRRSGGPLSTLLSRLLGLEQKREQYERGRAFFDAVVAKRGLDGAAAVWTSPETLPRTAELETPSRWLDRVPE